MRARQIFQEKKFSSLPVVSEDGQLMGGYTKWDDLIVLKNLTLYHRGLQAFLEEKNVVLVKPSTIFEEKMRYFDEWKNELEDLGIQVRCIDKIRVPDYCDKTDLILFVDEEDYNATKILLNCISGKEPNLKAMTYKVCLMALRSYEEQVLREICLSGVQILGVQCKENESEYSYNLRHFDLREKFIRAGVPKSGKIPLSAQADFFDEFYTKEYAEAICSLPVCYENVDGVVQVKDMFGEYCNEKNGERLTIDQPRDYNRTIYFIGPCLFWGGFVEDKHTIESFLQAKYNEAGMKIRVVNLGTQIGFILYLKRVLATSFHQGDIVVLYLPDDIQIEDFCTLNLEDILEKNDVPAKWMNDIVLHCNYKVNELFADAIYEKLKPMLEMPVKSAKEPILVDKDLMIKTYVDHYFADYDAKEYGTIGAIVMNCNPFTRGHRYLIEEALKQVNFLIIFVVEENKSVFTFDERFACVCDGVADLRNVMVVPSGPFILSQTTFPEYFVKIADEDIIKNVNYDVTLFAEKIAPRLNITYRFVGEEPEDMVTREYNLAMKRILPSKGIKVIEIPRKQTDRGIISATAVRKCLETGEFEALDELVPESTKKILFWSNE